MTEPQAAEPPIDYQASLPAPDDFARLFATTRWHTEGRIDATALREMSSTTWYAVSAYVGDRLVGMGRVIGDGLLHALITDVIVEPSFQGRGIGRAIVERLVAECRAHRILDVQLFGASGKRGFYERLGFVARPDDAPGMELVPATIGETAPEAGAADRATLATTVATDMATLATASAPLPTATAPLPTATAPRPTAIASLPTAAPTFPTAAMSLTRLLVVSELARATAWYRDVLGAAVTGEYGGTSCVLRFLDSWLLLVTGGPPTADKPTVAFAAPADPDRASAEMIIGVPDCRAAYEVLSARGATFLTPPGEYEWEIRAFFRDPDGHLFEISEARRNR